jgi:nucleoside-diphosphate-sugar epimerase
MKNILVIGGTHNMGFDAVLRLLEMGHRVTTLNRGMSPDELPSGVYRLRADRTDPQQMRRALLAKNFDVVIDFVMYRQQEAEYIVELLKDHVGHYIFISSGQVYLVREGIERPFKESDYEGRLLPPPKPNTYAFEEWSYGMGKRGAEDVLRAAYEAHRFPYTTLRMPMVNSERDSFRRLYSYIIRIRDGGGILVPETPAYPLRHVYAGDVVKAVCMLAESGQGKGDAFNISQDETVTIDEFIEILGNLMGMNSQIVRVKRSLLEANGFLPDCSPFSERWMSELDNSRSKELLGVTYTPLLDYLEKLVRYYTETKPPVPVGYKRRSAERLLVEQQLADQQ